MADYVSSLTGVAMDMALQDMAEHNSEAWAVGERNGIPVGSDDVTYQNNAQYYAQQAQSIAPASVTEAVRWDIAQTALTDANKAQARSNIDAGKNGAWSNRNLLDNWYFVGGGSQLGGETFPINQRGQTSYTGQLAIDRWHADDTVTLYSDYLNTGNGTIYQVCDNGKITPLLGKAVTASMMLADGTIVSDTQVFPDDTNNRWVIFGSTGMASFLAGTTSQIIRLPGSNNIKAAKLELGTVSTLANDVAPDFGEELRKCQRYLWHKTFGGNTQIGCGTAIDASTAIIDVVMPASMRATPTITFTANVLLVGNGGVVIAASVIGINEYDNHLRLVVSATGLTAYQVYSFLTTTTTTMTVSAEL